MAADVPTSDHFDGRRFFNPGGTAPHGLAEVLRWRREREPARWPRHVSNRQYAPPPARIDEGAMAATFIGHASFLLQIGALRVLVDPIFSDRCSPVSWAGPRRVRPPGIAFAELPPIDLLLVSHNHYDHMDLPTLRALARRDDPAVVTPLRNAAPLRQAGLKRIEELDWWGETRVGAVRITATPARHFSARTPFDRNRALWSGFMLEAGGRRLLFAGDSGAGPHWAQIGERLGAPDLALLPIGAYAPRWFMAPVHMDPADAVRAHLALGARRSIGMHFGTFQLTDEAMDDPPRELAIAARAQGVADAFTVLGEGETLVLPTFDDG